MRRNASRGADHSQQMVDGVVVGKAGESVGRIGEGTSTERARQFIPGLIVLGVVLEASQTERVSTWKHLSMQCSRIVPLRHKLYHQKMRLYYRVTQ